MLLKNRIKFPNTLAFKLTLWYALTFVTFSSLAFLVLYLSINSILSHEIDEDLIEDVAEFKILYQSDGMAGIQKEMIREVNSDDPKDIFIRLFDIEGHLIFSTDLTHWSKLKTDSLLFRIPSPNNLILETAEFNRQEYKTRMIYGFLDSKTIIHIGETTESKEEIMELLFLVISILFSILIPTVSFIAWFMARKAVSGIKEVSRATVDIENGDYKRRVLLSTPTDELQQLANTFNSMAERVQILIIEMREMTDNIAHDLRSPLARIRAISENILSSTEKDKDCNEAASDTLEECDRLIHLINTTLDVAEAEAGIDTIAKENIDLYQVTKDTHELYEIVAEQKNIQFTSTLEPVQPIFGNRNNLRRMIGNLIDNALKYTPEDGLVNIKLKAGKQEVLISISDSGVGIPVDDQTRIFNRFFRCDQSRTQNGCGLGLSFARAVAHAHGGEIIVTSIPHQSSTFTIALPVTRFTN